MSSRLLLLLAPVALLALAAGDAVACSADAVTPAACFGEVALGTRTPRVATLPDMPAGLAVCAMLALALPPMRRGDRGTLRLETPPL